MEDSMIQYLLEQAVAASRRAYAPYSHFPVGAALLCESGNIYTGCNVENQSFPAGMCAERVALGSAVAAGEQNFKAIAIVSGSKRITPCGFCRQALAEFGDLSVICGTVNGEYRLWRLSSLLPEQFEFSEQ